jgi:hypothetical protein
MNLRKAIAGTTLGLMSGVILLTGCATQPPTTEAPPPQPTQTAFRPAISLNDVMVSVVDHNAHMLWNVGLPGRAPKNDEDWHQLEHAADTLAAAGGIISSGGSGPNDTTWVRDPEWQTLTQQMTDAALEITRAVEEKNVEAVLTAGNLLVPACEGCHMKFKTEVPAHIAGPSEQPEHYGHE